MRKPLIPWVCRVVCVILLGLALPAYAEWFKDYEAAMELVKKNQWAAAVPKLQSAISQKNEEGSHIKFYGMKFGDYFPHYYLGLAYFNLKNYEAAISEFEKSERFGAIQKKGDLYARLENSQKLARAQIATTQPPPVLADNKPPVITQPSEDVKPPVEEPPTKIEPPVAKKEVAKELKKEEPKVQPPPVVVQKVPDVSQETAKAIAREGALKYFAGDFDAAISLLSSALQKDPKNSPAQFLLGCSYAAKFLLTGSQDQDLYGQAALAFRKSKQMNPSYKANQTYFSPAILEIYAKAG